jgi:hypothetical protein
MEVSSNMLDEKESLYLAKNNFLHNNIFAKKSNNHENP